MNRPVRLAASLAALAILAACSTLIGHAVSGTLQELQVDGAKITYWPPAHCSRPHDDAKFMLGDGVEMTISNHFGKGLDARFSIDVGTGRSFAFTSTTGRVDFPDGSSRSDVVIAHTTWSPTSHAVWSDVAPDVALAGPAAGHDFGVFSGNFGARDVSANEFTVQLPDAVVNGSPYRFPAIRVKGRAFEYFEDACLR